MGMGKTDISIEEAKRIAQDTETSIVDSLPASMVSSVEQDPTGVLIRCDKDRGYQWTGHTVVTLTPSTTVESVISHVLSAFEGNEELRPRDVTDSVGPGAQLLGPYNSGYIVDRRANDAVNVASFSPCFDLPEDRSPSIEY